MTPPRLNLPEYSFKIKPSEGSASIFDPIRKKYIKLTPEEWVRQNFIQYLVQEKRYPQGRIAVETTIEVNGLKRRCDAVIFDSAGKPFLIIECKAPSVSVSQKTFDQIARYNLALNVTYLVVTNGIHHFCCKMTSEEKNYTFLKEMPEFLPE